MAKKGSSKIYSHLTMWFGAVIDFKPNLDFQEALKLGKGLKGGSIKVGYNPMPVLTLPEQVYSDKFTTWQTMIFVGGHPVKSKIWIKASAPANTKLSAAEVKSLCFRWHLFAVGAFPNILEFYKAKVSQSRKKQFRVQPKLLVSAQVVSLHVPKSVLGEVARVKGDRKLPSMNKKVIAGAWKAAYPKIKPREYAVLRVEAKSSLFAETQNGICFEGVGRKSNNRPTLFVAVMPEGNNSPDQLEDYYLRPSACLIDEFNECF